MLNSKEEKDTVTTTMSKAYQITVPSVVRKRLALQPGDGVDLRIEGNSVRLFKALTREEQIRRIFVELDRLKDEREKRMTPEQKEFAQKTAGWTVRQWHEYIGSLPETQAYIKEKYGI